MKYLENINKIYLRTLFAKFSRMYLFIYISIFKHSFFLLKNIELQDILKMLVGGNLPEEQMNAIAERTIAELGDQGILINIDN